MAPSFLIVEPACPPGADRLPCELVRVPDGAAALDFLKRHTAAAIAVVGDAAGRALLAEVGRRHVNLQRVALAHDPDDLAEAAGAAERGELEHYFPAVVDEDEFATVVLASMDPAAAELTVLSAGASTSDLPPSEARTDPGEGPRGPSPVHDLRAGGASLGPSGGVEAGDVRRGVSRERVPSPPDEPCSSQKLGGTVIRIDTELDAKDVSDILDQVGAELDRRDGPVTPQV